MQGIALYCCSALVAAAAQNYQLLQKYENTKGMESLLLKKIHSNGSAI
jgi:hypothetical protein